uniref:Putative secreted protein n=1 Tax=Ixodes ricinus TaxID=34613 RepID=A0A6B0UF57_IXORI
MLPTLLKFALFVLSQYGHNAAPVSYICVSRPTLDTSCTSSPAFFPNLNQTLPRFLKAMLSNPWVLLQGPPWRAGPWIPVGRHVYL